MPAPNVAPAYLRDLASAQGQNQATDYLRYQAEIDRQRHELEARRRHNSSLGQRMLRGLGGALKGGAMGAMSGNPFVALGAAGAGFAGGAIDSGNGDASSQIGQSVGSLGAMASMAAGRYLGGSPAAPSLNGDGGAARSGELALGSVGGDVSQLTAAERARLAGLGLL